MAKSMYDLLKNRIKNKRLILIGEIHGAEEITLILSKFFAEVAKREKFILCLEIPNEHQLKINAYMESGEDKFLANIKFDDGRDSYLKLIRKLYSLLRDKITLYCIELPAKNQKDKELGLYTNLSLTLLNKEKIFAVLGDIHASSKKINLKKIEIIPVGYLLKILLGKKMFNIRIAKKGKGDKIFNKGFDKVISF